MKIIHKIALYSLLSLPIGSSFTSMAQIKGAVDATDEELAVIENETDSVADAIDSTLFQVRDLEVLLDTLYKTPTTPPPTDRINGPWIYSGFRPFHNKKPYEMNYLPVYPGMKVATNDSIIEIIDENLADNALLIAVDSIPSVGKSITIIEEEEDPGVDLSIFDSAYTPAWLREAVLTMRLQDDLMYSTMVFYPSTIDYTYWGLPVPPRLPDDDVSFEAYIKKLELPEVEADKAILPEEVIRKIHWLHNFNSSAQFSQAYVSSNWYQGGNNHLALLLGINWNVQLNQVYHPNLLFQSALSYKLGLNSSPQDEVHKYSISEDLLQWNLNVGLKARKKWYYSFNTLFKTQILNNYLPNSKVQKASFMSPGDFNMGLGMSYSQKKTNFQLTTTISPFSYNLKTCISDKINHGQFNIADDAHTHSEFGSNAEVNMAWKIMSNISYKTRLFLFTDYSYFLADWEHTLNFDINKFLSTQIYVHMRYDTSTETLTKWKHFMLREVLSFGLSYTFSTK